MKPITLVDYGRNSGNCIRWEFDVGCEHIADVEDPCMDDDLTPQQKRARERKLLPYLYAMAAAPELLKACEVALRRIQHLNTSGPEEKDPTETLLENAIARAQRKRPT